MSNTSSINVELTLPKAKLRKLKAFLDDEGGKMVSQIEKDRVYESKNSITKGSYRADEKPSDFSGIWKNDNRDIEEMRRKAWSNRGIKW